MDADRIDRVTGWDSESFSDGFDGLRALADRDFSGAVTDGAAWLFMLNGRVVGVVDGDLDGFETASGTAYEAPHESLPLLYAMLEQGGRERAQYYTNDTLLSEADKTLSAGNFTGYIELSENVLSGDYYVAYYGGNSLSAAFTGSSNDTLKTGEEAFDLANDEVGIYTVNEVDLNVREVPSSPAGTGAGGSNSTGTSAATGAGATAAGATDESTDPDGSGLDGITVDDAESDSSTQPDATSTQPDATTKDSGPVNPDPSAAAAGSSEPGERDEGDTTDPPGSVSSTAPSTAPSTSATREESEAAGTDPAGDRRDAEATDAEATDAEPTDTAAADAGRATDTEPDAGSTAPSAGAKDTAGSEGAASGEETRNADADADDAPKPGDDVFSEEEEWRETKSIPALDPDESADVVGEQQSGPGGRTSSSSATTEGSVNDSSAASSREQRSSSASAGNSSRSKNSRSKNSRSKNSRSQRSRSNSNAANDSADDADASTDDGDVSERESVKRSQLHRRVNRLESALEETEAKRKALVTERDEVAAERDELQERNQQLESRVAELEAELEDVRGELREARSQLPDGDQVITPAEAREGTNLFVRYGSQGGATLEKAHDGEIGREELVTNLQLEHHTSFESDGVVVDDQPYEAFLRDTMEYGFTKWLIEDLLFEIQDTGNVSALQELYDAIPEIDRAEIGGTVQIVHEENGQETREQRGFDLVLRNRMGNPLFVADLNASRDPTEKASLDQLVEDSSLVADSGEEFASAFAVTSSFFKPGALETADDATGGGLLSRSKQKSYVKISRKQGYHLCLAESRDGGFHLTVPEL